MSAAKLFIFTLLCWSPTWFVIKFHFGIVDPLVSLFYRFFVSGLLILIYLHFKDRKKFTIANHCLFLLLGTFLFSLQYMFYYSANVYLISGVVSISLSLILIFNILGEKLYFNISPSIKTIFACGLGFLGLSLVYKEELVNFSFYKNTHFGIILSFIAAFFASTGNMIFKKIDLKRIDFWYSLGFGMLYGSFITLLTILILGKKINFEISYSYIFSLAYLIFFGSILAFYFYLRLLKKVGAGRAGYFGIIMPPIALLISSILENYIWSFDVILGLLIISYGSYLILNQKTE